VVWVFKEKDSADKEQVWAFEEVDRTSIRRIEQSENSMGF
jgi:hypothetical protein